jgi:O-antigen/teichoic acid export membrane protein
LTPKSGLSYWLGVTGASMMALLFGYYLRKRINPKPVAIRSLPVWFRMHVILGIAGPMLILFHCNFRFGAFNSNVALLSMGAVVVSGVVGRYLYRFAYHSQVSAFERLLSAWRLLHAPLCVVLAIAAVMHIWAVHRF